jgi:hypothetical protein
MERGLGCGHRNDLAQQQTHNLGSTLACCHALHNKKINLQLGDQPLKTRLHLAIPAETQAVVSFRHD